MSSPNELLASVKPAFTNISPARDVVASFDREGRLFSYVAGGRTYRRTLASDVEVRERAVEGPFGRKPSERNPAERNPAERNPSGRTPPGRKPPRVRRRLSRDEAYRLFAEVLQAVEDVLPRTDGEL